jgi:hypothetical protein
MTYHSFGIMVARIDGLGIMMSLDAEIMIRAGTGARRKGEGDEGVGSKSSSLQSNKGGKLT